MRSSRRATPSMRWRAADKKKPGQRVPAGSHRTSVAGAGLNRRHGCSWLVLFLLPAATAIAAALMLSRSLARCGLPGCRLPGRCRGVRCCRVSGCVRCGGTGLGAAGEVRRRVAVSVIDHALVVDVGDEDVGDIGDGPVMGESAAPPFSAEEPDATIAEAVIHAPIEADMWPPIAGMEAVHAAF